MTSPAGIEVFGNQPVATITGSLNNTDSTDTLSASWVSGLTWPVASTSAVPNTFFRIVDQAANSEVMLVTSAAGGAGPVSGQSWTVTRGYEGTAKVTHAAGWTAQQVISAGTLQQFKQASTAGTSPVTITTSTTETVLANYQPVTADLAAGTTFAVVAYGPLTAHGGSARGTLAFNLYWGGSGAAGAAFTSTGSTLIGSLKTGSNAPPFAATTVIAGASFDVWAEVTVQAASAGSVSSVHCNMNTNLAAGAALTTATLVGSCADVTASGGASGSGPISVTAGTGPLILTAVWTANYTVYGLTAVAPEIYRIL